MSRALQSSPEFEDLLLMGEAVRRAPPSPRSPAGACIALTIIEQHNLSFLSALGAACARPAALFRDDGM